MFALPVFVVPALWFRSWALALPTFAADAGDADDAWKVDAPHGPTHDVPIAVDEATWTHVTVHGNTVVFDVLGDLWAIPLAGGVAKQLTSGPAWDTEPAFSPKGDKLAFTSDRGGNENIWIMNADGTAAEAFTDEDVARCTDPVWDPSGPYLVYRRRTVDTRSIGVTEIWQRHLDGGDGFALTSKDEHPHAADAWVTGRYLWFASRQGRFEYDASAVAGLWDLVRLDRWTGDQRVVVHGGGSAGRPVVSADERTLYFVSRERENTILESLDLASGRRTTITSPIANDELEAFALHGTYPKIARTGDGDLVLWAGGKLWRIDPDSKVKVEIPFQVSGTWTMADVARPRRTISDAVTPTIVRWPTVSARGAWAYSALGALWVRTGEGSSVQTTRVSDGTGYAPAWSPDGTSLAWTGWDDETGGSLYVTGKSGASERLPVEGQLTEPAWSDDGREIVVLRGAGGDLPGADLSGELYYDVVHLVPSPGIGGPKWEIAHTFPIDGQPGPRHTHLRLHSGRVWYVEQAQKEPREPEVTTLVSVRVDGTDRREHIDLGEAEEVVISPDFTRLAYVRDHAVWLTALPPFPRATAGAIGVDALPTRKITQVGGGWLGFSAEGRSVTWSEGPDLKMLAVDDVWMHTDDAEGDDAEGEDAEGDDGKDSPKDPFEADPRIVTIPVGLTVPRARPEGALLLRHARLVTMVGDEVLGGEGGVDVRIERDRIVAIGADLPTDGARELDCTGKTVIPGLVDVHAHLHFGSGDVFPEQDWRYATALDFGVTTVHDPSAWTDLVFTQAQRIEAGYERGPRVYSTGRILYGAQSVGMAETPDPDEARRHVRRMALAGAGSVKVYQQSQRERRQWYVQACREQGVLCVPEGGGDLPMDLSMVVDGFHAVEHALPDAPLYADVRALFAGSRGAGTDHGDGYGTFYTPTLQVAYGGLSGKHWFIQHGNPVDDPRLRRHTPTRVLEQQLWRPNVLAQDADWRYQQTARDAARMRDAGVHVTLGAHGELQGLGVHWELWALGGPGAMTAHQALAAATIEGARYLGLDRELGSIEVGKLADLVVLDADPLADLHATTAIAWVVKNGEVYE